MTLVFRDLRSERDVHHCVLFPMGQETYVNSQNLTWLCNARQLGWLTMECPLWKTRCLLWPDGEHKIILPCNSLLYGCLYTHTSLSCICIMKLHISSLEAEHFSVLMNIVCIFIANNWESFYICFQVPCLLLKLF